MSKYIGGFGDEMRPVTRAEVERVITDNWQYGSVRERRATCMRILRRGETLQDGLGYSVRLARLPRE